ncbi:hypothetical protein FQN54_005729 [Arachnomyces sp. PD_36]|nr:hypothetical protein FQN54_005729 [Arachnomyces sp. PD_36]
MLSTEERRQPYGTAPAMRLPHKGINLSSPASTKSHNQQQHIKALSQEMKPAKQPVQHIWIVTGPAGCGKTTVAQALAKELALPYIEGDDYHSKSNKDKMAHNIPLTDADRWDWLILLREAAVTRLSTPSTNYSTTLPEGVIVTCSALKQKYRDVMRVATYNHPDVRIHFIYLRADEEVLMARVNARKNHYMKSSMVHSQFEMLEEPDAEWDALAIDVSATPGEVQQQVFAVVRSKLAEEEESR